MANDNREQDTPTFRRPNEQKQYEDDPFADQRRYFAYWEARRITDMQKRRDEEASMSVYERSRLRR